jgi:putative SOS response-associated peptidase YedK
MCGRYVNVASNNDLTEEFDVEEVVGDDPGPSWNVAPTDPVRVIVERAPREPDAPAAAIRQLRTVRWGLVPNWSRDSKGGAKMINARIETVTEIIWGQPVDRPFRRGCRFLAREGRLLGPACSG